MDANASYQMENLEAVSCKTLVCKKLPSCEHFAMIACSEDDLANVTCQKTCNSDMDCCSEKCTGRCGDCQKLSRGYARPGSLIERTKHARHPCLAPVPTCGHLCQYDCGSNHKHSTVTCLGDCLRVCTHSTCPEKCSVACAPCEYLRRAVLTPRPAAM